MTGGDTYLLGSIGYGVAFREDALPDVSDLKPVPHAAHEAIAALWFRGGPSYGPPAYHPDPRSPSEL